MIKNLKKLRMKKGISQQKLGEILGISQQSVNKYENQDCEPDIKMLISISEFFHTTIDYLVGKEKEEKEDKNNDNTENSNSYDLSEKEADFIERYRNFSIEQQDAFSCFLDAFSNSYNNDDM